eukprot:12410376-Alexandrium_andersonii.AAC.1
MPLPGRACPSTRALAACPHSGRARTYAALCIGASCAACAERVHAHGCARAHTGSHKRSRQCIGV